jgi:GntR family transcriptional regulator
MAVPQSAGEVAQRLLVPEGGPVIRLERLRYARGEPLARLRNFLPASLVAR